MPKKPETDLQFSPLYLAESLEQEVNSWSSQGWKSGATQTTQDLLEYWFCRDEEQSESFYKCQQQAIETIIYCHEVLGIKTLKEFYQRLKPEALEKHLSLKEEVESIPFEKYCLKMATGTGKTYVLFALMVWQYFNHLNQEKKDSNLFSSRFLIVAPGMEVLNRLLDAFKGKKDPKTGNRDPATSYEKMELFLPPGASWRERFHLEKLEPRDVRPNMTPPDGPFVYLTNWQQFVLRKKGDNLWEKYTGEDVEEKPRGEIILDFLSGYQDLVVLNDEAHHVHGNKTAKGVELVWRKFMKSLHNEMQKNFPDDTGLFMQIDFSATPFFGTGAYKEFFPHIVYDYDLPRATKNMLVKQIFLEERQALGGERLEELDFRAERLSKSRAKDQVKGLSAGQKVMLEIGKSKLEQIAEEFKAKGIARKPVLMVLCEDTRVADLVVEHFLNLRDENDQPYDQQKVMAIHTELKDAQLTEARNRLDKIDDDNDPLRVVVSVLMLREGFDKTNICVTVVLRATEADLLLEQIVGRGLRLMFPEYKSPDFWGLKKEAFDQLSAKQRPSNCLDFLFIVEHPKFRKFYENLREKGYLIGEGDTSQQTTTGDLIPVDVMPERIENYDIAWPVMVYEEAKIPDISAIDPAKLPAYSSDFETLKSMLSKISITDRHLETGTKAKTWKMDNKYFDYNHFLRSSAEAISRQGKTPVLTAAKAKIAGLVDDYVSTRLFGKAIDFSIPENYTVLNFILVFDFVVGEVRKAIVELMDKIHYQPKAGWRRLSDLKRIMLRESKSIETIKCIYPRQGYAPVGGGFERDFIQDILIPSPEVLAFARLQRKHGLAISYRDDNGILRNYEVDFIIKTAEKIFLLETKGDRDIESETVRLKARSAQGWCENACGIDPIISQPGEWEYLIITQSLFNFNRGLSFSALVPACIDLRKRLEAGYKGKLF